MWSKNLKYACMFGFCLLLLLLFPSCTPAYASEYRITEAELTRLESNLQKLAEHSQSKQKLLNRQSEQLQALNEQLQKSLKQNEETQTLLQTANESLQQYEQEVKRKQAIKDRQRDVWAAVACLAVTWAIVK